MSNQESGVEVMAVRGDDGELYLIPKDWVNKCRVSADQEEKVAEGIKAEAFSSLKFSTLEPGSPISVVF
ncbi:hypothetical protein [Ruegeria arenilitoris]|uniref:hypothetical protein n=1 Tax=Ruegeria arenilitoris TaxID=1173585 RepID=UPI00147FF665|nr:hypothetical protein [Ruegeria arenilitoris]